MDETDTREFNPRPKGLNWAPYILILPSLVYLALFFAWPMARGLALAVWDDEAYLSVWVDPGRESALAGRLPQGVQVTLLGQQGNVVAAEELGTGNILTETWFRVHGEELDGWAPESRIRVREEDATGNPIAGSVRRKLGTGADPLTSIYAEANERAQVVGKLDAAVTVEILDRTVLEVWYRVRGEGEVGAVEGWVQSRYLQVFSDGERGRVDRGNVGQLTGQFFAKMVNDRFFWPALRTTLLLMVMILPVQFILAIIMALVIQSRIRGNTVFLYIFSIPLGVSDLAVGLVFFSIFTQNGFLNSFLQTVGVISSPAPFLTADTRHWIIIAIWLAEVWRATSIVMVIVVSGLQAISNEVLEAAEVFGAGLWQRLRHIILPMLRPSLQVALILRTILALQVFAVVIALGGGDVITVLSNETYRQYFEFRNPNMAAAYAGFILALSMISATIYLRLVRTQEELAT